MVGVGCGDEGLGVRFPRERGREGGEIREFAGLSTRDPMAKRPGWVRSPSSALEGSEDWRWGVGSA